MLLTLGEEGGCEMKKVGGMRFLEADRREVFSIILFY